MHAIMNFQARCTDISQEWRAGTLWQEVMRTGSLTSRKWHVQANSNHKGKSACPGNDMAKSNVWRSLRAGRPMNLVGKFLRAGTPVDIGLLRIGLVLDLCHFQYVRLQFLLPPAQSACPQVLALAPLLKGRQLCTPILCSSLCVRLSQAPMFCYHLPILHFWDLDHQVLHCANTLLQPTGMCHL